MFTRLLLTYFICGLTTVNYCAYAEDTAIIKDQNGCKIYNPAPQENETVEWSGSCADGYANGKGILDWFIGKTLTEKYVGEMKHGWAEGKGTLTSTNGIMYEGEWRQSQQDGQGKQKMPDGSTYSGEWKNGKPHGLGTYVSSDGRIVSGQWEDGNLISEADAHRI